MKLSKVVTRFRYEDLADICTRSTASFEEFGEKRGEGETLHFFKDNGSPILAVAHLDSVQEDEQFCARVDFPKSPRVYSPTLDDRLGAFTILKYLPALGIKTDILLTDNEEGGQSTAQFFRTDKRYNWMFMFDRKGDDVVLYQYDDAATREKVQKCGFRVSHGSYSCIRKLEDLGCKGFNFGCGYDDYHSPHAFVDLRTYWQQVQKFTNFYWQFHRTEMPHTKTIIPISAARTHHYIGPRSPYTRDLWEDEIETTVWEWDMEANDHWREVLGNAPPGTPMLTFNEMAARIPTMQQQTHFACPRCRHTEQWVDMYPEYPYCFGCSQPLFDLLS